VHMLAWPENTFVSSLCTMVSAMVPPHLLIFDLHSVVLRCIAANTGEHYNGLQIASRHLSRGKCISNKLARQLVLLDHAFSVARHIDEVVCNTLVKDLSDALASPQPPRAKIDSSYHIFFGEGAMTTNLRENYFSARSCSERVSDAILCPCDADHPRDSLPPEPADDATKHDPFELDSWLLVYHMLPDSIAKFHAIEDQAIQICERRASKVLHDIVGQPRGFLDSDFEGVVHVCCKPHCDFGFIP